MSEPSPPPPRLKDLLSLAWPIVVARSAQVVVGFSDAVMVGSLGESALAATTTGAFNALLLFVFPMGTVFIVSSYSSQLFGKGHVRAARRYGWYGIGIAAAAGVVFVASIPTVPTVLGCLSFDDEVRSLMSAYLAVRLLSGVGAVGLDALGNYYGGLGNTRLPMLAQILAMVLNVLLNWVLIFGHLGAPALGVVGAAWASVVATTTAFLLLLLAFIVGFGVPDAPAPSSEGQGEVPSTEQELPPASTDDDAGLSWREFFAMLRFGVPSGMNWFLEFAAFNFFINIVVAGLGTTSLAALNAVFQVNAMSFMPAFGIASAGAILFGQQLGRGHTDHAKSTAKLTLYTTGVWQSAVGLLYLLIPTTLMGVFTPASEGAFLEVGARMLMLSAAWQLSDAVVNTYAEMLRAAGDTSFTMWARVTIAWLLFVPGSYASVVIWPGGDVAAVLCLVGYLGLLAVVLGLRFRSGRWKSIDLFGGDVRP